MGMCAVREIRACMCVFVICDVCGVCVWCVCVVCVLCVHMLCVFACMRVCAHGSGCFQLYHNFLLFQLCVSVVCARVYHPQTACVWYVHWVHVSRRNHELCGKVVIIIPDTQTQTHRQTRSRAHARARTHTNEYAPVRVDFGAEESDLNSKRCQQHISCLKSMFPDHICTCIHTYKHTLYLRIRGKKRKRRTL